MNWENTRRWYWLIYWIRLKSILFVNVSAVRMWTKTLTVSQQHKSQCWIKLRLRHLNTEGEVLPSEPDCWSEFCSLTDQTNICFVTISTLVQLRLFSLQDNDFYSRCCPSEFYYQLFEKLLVSFFTLNCRGQKRPASCCTIIYSIIQHVIYKFQTLQKIFLYYT